MKISEVMTKEPLFVDSECSVREALNAAGERGIEHLLICDHGEIVGVACAQCQLSDARLDGRVAQYMVPARVIEMSASIEEAALRIRLEAEAAARSEEQARLLAHEQKLATIDAEKKKGVHPGIIVGIILLLVGGGVGAYFGVVKPQLEERDRAARLAAEQAERGGGDGVDVA